MKTMMEDKKLELEQLRLVIENLSDFLRRKYPEVLTEYMKECLDKME